MNNHHLQDGIAQLVIGIASAAAAFALAEDVTVGFEPGLIRLLIGTIVVAALLAATIFFSIVGALDLNRWLDWRRRDREIGRHIAEMERLMRTAKPLPCNYRTTAIKKEVEPSSESSAKQPAWEVVPNSRVRVAE